MEEAERVRSSPPKMQTSTVSSNDDTPIEPGVDLVHQRELSADMMINCLYRCRDNSQATLTLLDKLYKLCSHNAVPQLHAILFLISLNSKEGLDNRNIFEKFLYKAAENSLTQYLLLQWAFTTYLAKSKEEACFLLPKTVGYPLRNQLSRQQGELETGKETSQELSRYLSNVNQFFNGLFLLPQNLKKINQSQVNPKLRYLLKQLVDKFCNQKPNLMDGLLLPLRGGPNNSGITVAVDWLYEQCFCYSTPKGAPPLKIVLHVTENDDPISQELPRKEKSSYRSCESNSSDCLLLPHSYFGAHWEQKKEQYFSKCSHRYPSSQLMSFIIKSGDDFRQEYLAMRLVHQISSIFELQDLALWVKPYAVIPYSSQSGLIQFINDTRTISCLKELSGVSSLKTIYHQIFGSNFETARKHFIQSCAGYSVLQYILDIKDRHNKNILIDRSGHMVHIDFSYMMGVSPGGIYFEKGPFKLTPDYIEMMEGTHSDLYLYFKQLIYLGLKFLATHSTEIVEAAAMMSACQGLNCFGKLTKRDIEARLHLNATDRDLEKIVEGLVRNAETSRTTALYDHYQWHTNAIYF